MDRVFYIFRHGETDWNKERRCQGHTDTFLNQLGEEQAAALALKLASIPIEIIYSSDLNRAQKTGKIVADHLEIPLVVDQRLREMSFGEAEGMIFLDAIEKFGEEFWQKLQSFKKENDHIGFPGGETRFMARERFLNVIEEIIHQTNFKVIGLSTHGGALRNVMQYFLPEEHPIISIPNCVVYRLIYNAQTKKIIADANPL